MANKKNRLIQRAQETVRMPKPPHVVDAKPPKKGYRVVAVSLYTPEADWIEQTTEALKRAGNPKASRSLVVREAILRLQDTLKDKNAAEILTDFTEREARRGQHS